MPTKQECIMAVAEASKISQAEAKEALDLVEKEKKRLGAIGQLNRSEAELAKWAQKKADDMKMKASLARKQAALNIMKRDPLDAQIRDVEMSTKGNIKEAILSTVQGTHKKGAVSGRHSPDAARLAIVTEWAGSMTKELSRKPEMKALLKDPDFLDAIVREMHEIRDGGKPGITGNANAKYAADVFAKYAEISRIRVNEAGANIGKLGGWVPQNHDAAKMLKVKPKEWAEKVLAGLDVERTFPDVTDPDEIRKILEDIYVTISTGRGHGITAAQRGEFVGPRNLAKSVTVE